MQEKNEITPSQFLARFFVSKKFSCPLGFGLFML